jgi:hypothetical protein
MTRVLLIVLAAGVSGCAGTTMFEPTPTIDAEALQREFTSEVLPGGGASRTFDVSAPGPIAVTLTSTSPAGVTMGVGVGIPRGDGSCALQASVHTPAGSAAQIAISADSGTYCAKAYDPGTLRAPVAFTISISRP